MSDGEPQPPHGRPPAGRPNPYAQPQPGPYGQPAAYPQQAQHAQQAPYAYPGQGAPQAGPPSPYAFPQQAPPPGPGVPGQFPGYPQQQYASPTGQPAFPGQFGPQQVAGGPLANWGQRVGAYLIDYVVYEFLGIILYWVGFSMRLDAAMNPQDYAANGGGGSGTGAVFLLLGFLLMVGGAVTMCAMEGRTGQTIGKRAVGIRLVRMQSPQPIGFGLSLGRRLLHVLDSIVCIGFLRPLWNPAHQTWADSIAGTVVVKTR